MLKFLVELFVLYLIYKLVFDLIIPVYRATRHIRQNVQRNVDEYQANNHETARTPPKPERTDYIDFEEIKDWLMSVAR